MDKIGDIIIEHLGVLPYIIIVVTGLLVFAAWWVRGLWEKTKTIDSLPCKDHDTRIKNQGSKHHEMDKMVTQVTTSITYMQKSIDSLLNNLSRSNMNAADPFTQTSSPLSITVKGEEMAKNLGLRNMVDKKWATIKAMIDADESSENPYDIQQFCIQQAVVYPELFLEPSDLNTVKRHAYEMGNQLQSYMKVIAVMVRDRYFKENNIDVNEVDVYSP